MRKLPVLVVLVAIVATLLAILPAQASITGFDPRFIAIDGNVTVEPGSCNPPGSPCIDWLVKQGDGTLVGIIDGVANNDTDILSPDSILSSGSSLPKQDITRVWLSNNTTYLYLAEERRANNGNSSYHLFFTKIAPTAVAGAPVVYHFQNKDIEIRICFPKGSDPSGANIGVYQVTGVTGVRDVRAQDIWAAGILQPNAAAVAGFAINTNVVQALAGALDSHAKPTNIYDTATFAEAAVSLSALGITACGSAAWASVITRASCSLTSDVKDIAGPVLYNFGGPELSAITRTGPDCENHVCFSASVDKGLPPYDYTWRDNGAIIAQGTAPGPNPVALNLCPSLAPGSHHLTLAVTDAGGCSADADSPVFTVYSLLGASVDPAEIQCTGTTCAPVRIVGHPSGGDGNYAYQWKEGSTVLGTSSTLDYCFSPGDHSLTFRVTDGRGCVKEVPTAIHVLPAVGLILEIVSPLDCVSEVTLKATATGGNGNYTYTWKVDGVTVLVDHQAAGGPSYYTVVFPDDDYCAAKTVEVSVADSRACANPAPNPSETLTKTTTVARSP